MLYTVEFADGTRSGPVSAEDLVDWARTGRIGPADTVVDETGARMPASAVPGFSEVGGTVADRADPFGIIQCRVASSSPESGTEVGGVGPAGSGAASSEAKDLEPPPVILPPVLGPASYEKPPPPPATMRRSALPAIVLICLVSSLGVPLLVFFALASVRIMRSAKVAADSSASELNAKELAAAVLMYQEDNDNRFPPVMSSARRVAPYVRRYIESGYPIRVAGTSGGELLGNGALAGLDASIVVDPTTTVMFYESRARLNGTVVAYADGHVARVRSFDPVRELKKTALLKPNRAPPDAGARSAN